MKLHAKKITTVHSTLHLIIGFFMVWISAFAYAAAPETELKASMESQLKGEWISPKWNYGFRIDGLSGFVTQWNYKYNPNDKTKTGDKILVIEKYTETGFVGQQQFFNGKMVPIVVTWQDAKTIKLEAGPEVWLMVRPQ